MSLAVSARMLLIYMCCAGFGSASAADLSTIALLLPQSGCAVSAAETVRVRVINYGTPLPPASMFSYGYSINGGLPVTETVFMGNGIPTNGMVTYSFVNPADLSQPGIYAIDATITVSGDSDPSNNGLAAQSIQNWAPSIGGVVSGPPPPATAGTFNLTGQLGSILEWQQTNDDERWQALENTTAAQGFAGLDRATRFRAVVRNGPCAPVNSASALAAPDAIFLTGFES